MEPQPAAAFTHFPFMRSVDIPFILACCTSSRRNYDGAGALITRTIAAPAHNGVALVGYWISRLLPCRASLEIQLGKACVIA